MLNEMFAIVFYLTHDEVQSCASTVSINRCDKKAIILVCNVCMNLYVGLCNIDFITLMAIINTAIMCNVRMNLYVGLCCFPAGLTTQGGRAGAEK